MLFSVGYQLRTDDSLINTILKNKNKIREVYFAWEDFPNGRNTLSNSDLSIYEARKKQSEDFKRLLNAVYRNKTAENQMNFTDAAVKCGIGEKGMSGAVLTKDFGPMIRYCFILTDAVIEPDEIKELSLCDKCGKCIKACPGNAISENGEVDPWQCAVYYNGANGTKNPFMPPDAFADFENRIEIIAGEAKVTPETARKILDEIFFYPPAQHAYQCSICGRACDTACYIHLEEKGVLNKKFNRKFRTRESWAFSIEDFKK